MSSSDLAIAVRGISKAYRITRNVERPSTLIETIGQQMRNAFRAPENETFWALDDVSFNVRRGEVVGVIGRNGAGKSTLLKILSRITEPTSGEIDLYGRIGSLLEVGTGFHPELTGRENIYLNGQILGMRRTEINRCFDAIVDFAEIEKFIDTPVKRYSSGMYVRLAFAVAAHLDPEILIVDEVLAVGDVAFQKKCLGRMGVVAAEGRTVLFVSHNMDAVKKLCVSGILLDQGKIEYAGDVNTAIERYINNDPTLRTTFQLPPPQDSDAPGRGLQLTIENSEGIPTNGAPLGSSWQVRISFEINREVAHFIIAVGVQTDRGTPVWTVWSDPQTISPGRYEAVFVNEKTTLCAGSYSLVVGLSTYERSFHYITDAALLIIAELNNGPDMVSITGKCGIVLNPMTISVERKS